MTFVLILLLNLFFQCDLMNSCSSIVIYMPIPKSICTAQFSHKHSQPVSLHDCRTHLLGRVPVWYLKNANVIVTLAFCCLKPFSGSDHAPLFHLLLTHSVMSTGSFLAGCICICFFCQFFQSCKLCFVTSFTHAVSLVSSPRSTFLSFEWELIFMITAKG